VSIAALRAQAPSAQASPSPAAAAPAAAGPASDIQPTPENYRFPNGTTYVYDAEWRLWRAGTVTLKIEAAGAQQRVSGAAESSGFVALLYKVHDRFQALFDAKTFCSVNVSKHTEEGFRSRDTLIYFDYAQRRALLNEKNLKSGEVKKTENDIPTCVTDVLSGLYYVASLPLQPDAIYKFPLNDGGKTVQVTLRVLGREQVKTDAGTFQTIKVEPEASEGVLKKRGRVWLWYSDDASRIPVQMRARMFWGTLTLKLQRIEK
jgi:hypothetical protein